MTNKKAVILLSGGIDSAVCLALAKSQNYTCYALSFDYGQRNRIELTAAKKIAEKYAVEHKIIKLPLNEFGGSALTDSNISVPVFTKDTAIPATYVPARNTIFLSIALAWAEVIKAFDIFVAANADDYHHYPDCRPDYFAAFAKVANLATKAGVEGQSFQIHAPLVTMHKPAIITLGNKLNLDFAATISCYNPQEHGAACGICDTCVLRKQGFQQAGVPDPTSYVI
jgi:7-cyano-7-deazaguanine synthase